MGAQLGYGRAFFFHCYKLITAFSVSHRIWCICIFAYVKISLDFPFGFFFDELVVQEYIVSFPLSFVRIFSSYWFLFYSIVVENAIWFLPS